MKDTLLKIICRYGTQFCAMAMFIAPLASEACRGKYYQPVEPEGLTDFVEKSKHK